MGKFSLTIRFHLKICCFRSFSIQPVWNNVPRMCPARKKTQFNELVHLKTSNICCLVIIIQWHDEYNHLESQTCFRNKMEQRIYFPNDICQRKSASKCTKCSFSIQLDTFSNLAEETSTMTSKHHSILWHRIIIFSKRNEHDVPQLNVYCIRSCKPVNGSDLQRNGKAQKHENFPFLFSLANQSAEIKMKEEKSKQIFEFEWIFYRKMLPRNVQRKIERDFEARKKRGKKQFDDSNFLTKLFYKLKGLFSLSQSIIYEHRNMFEIYSLIDQDKAESYFHKIFISQTKNNINNAF